MPFYNLGLAYHGLKEYESAAKAFRVAVDLKPKDPDAHYQLAYTYYKLNDKERFGYHYGKLIELNERMAKRLLRETYKLPSKIRTTRKGYSQK